MAGIPYCHDRADETPDKEEYEKAMGKQLPPDPGEFAGCRMKISAPDLDHVHLISAVTGHRITERLGIVACWAHAAWTKKAGELFDKQLKTPPINTGHHPFGREGLMCQDNAAAWLALAKR